MRAIQGPTIIYIGTFCKSWLEVTNHQLAKKIINNVVWHVFFACGLFWKEAGRRRSRPTKIILHSMDTMEG